MSDNKLAKGIYFKTPHENAPDWVKRKVSVNVDQFIEFLQEHKNDSGYVNFDLKEAKSTHWYMEVDDWQPNNSGNHIPDSSGNNQQSTDSAGFKPFAPPPFEGKKPENGLFQEDFDDIPF